MEALKRVGVNVQRLRRELELTQEELGERANVHQTYLSQVEGGRRNPSVVVLDRIAKALKVDIAELFRKG
jgi:transcriptional regulator with XRE-family HTH domain